jgi:IS5 family transposase
MQEAFIDTPPYPVFPGICPASWAFLPARRVHHPAFSPSAEETQFSEQILATVNEIFTQRGLLLKTDTEWDATLIAGLTSTKHKDKARDRDMHHSKKDDKWYFRMKAHTGVDANSELMHAVRGTSVQVSEVAEANILLHGEESIDIGNAQYQWLDNRPVVKTSMPWHIALRPGKRRALHKDNNADTRLNKAEKPYASVLAKAEHPFQVIKRQVGFLTVRYRGSKKNTAQHLTLIALSTLWMVRSTLIGAKAWMLTDRGQRPSKGWQRPIWAL